jgi:hypothetical protein
MHVDQGLVAAKEAALELLATAATGARVAARDVRRVKAALFEPARRGDAVAQNLLGSIELEIESERDRLLAQYRERVDGYAGVADDYREDWRRWCRAVLAHGGDLVVPPLGPEPDLDRLLEDGALQGNPARCLEWGGDCHANVAKLWLDGDIDTIGTGYALHEGLWRQHSWGVGEGGATVETKPAYEKYVGVALPHGEPTVRFVLNSYDGDIKEVLKARTGRANEIIQVLRARRSGPHEE